MPVRKKSGNLLNAPRTFTQRLCLHILIHIHLHKHVYTFIYATLLRIHTHTHLRAYTLLAPRYVSLGTDDLIVSHTYR